MRTKEELESLINGSLLFSIDRVKDAELFVVEERKFISDLADLMRLTRRDFAEIGSEIIITAKACIRAYKKESGVFLNYFNHALKTALIKEKIKETKYQEVVTSGNAPLRGKDGGEETEMFDLVAATDDSPEDKAVNADMVRYLVRLVNFVFQRLQDRTKALISKLLTVRLIDALLMVLTEAEILEETAFVDSEILTVYINGGELPTARQIAALHDTTEQQASRAIKTFLEKLMGNDKFAEACAYMKVRGVN